MSVQIDSHTHSHFSPDASPKATIEAMCESAVARGLKALAITDHYDLTLDFKFDASRREEEFALAKEKYRGRLMLLRGIELGEMVSDFAEAKRVLSLADYDVIMGSAHAVTGQMDFYDLPYDTLSDDTLRTLWEQYLAEMLSMVTNGTMSGASHIRYPERYYLSSGRAGLLNLEETGRDSFEPIFKKMIERGIALEINTKAPLKKGAVPDPGTDLLRFYKELGGRKVIVGSDAHFPENIGGGFAEAEALLESVGLAPLQDPEELRIW